MDIIRKEIVEEHELNLRTDGDKWMVTRKGCVIGFISLLPIKTKRYLLEFECSKNGCTLVEDFDSLEDAWNNVKDYISYFKL